ncbi:MAG: CHAP domain-containing protein, partial [Ruminococcus sp.]|nr:CHAP domain-containing protein [Ruminococcus sp.]
SVADIINGWLGAKEGDSVHAEILRIYNAQNPLPVGYKMQVHDAWCAATVSAAWLKAGIAQYTGTECGCGRFRDNAIKRGIWVEDDAYKPKIGDAVIYYWSDYGIGDCKTGADHIGLVTSVNGNSFTVTEGNTGNGIVGKRTMQVNGRYIRGFIAPNYAEITKKVSRVVTVSKPSPTPTPAKTTTIPDITYRVCVAGHWQAPVKNGATTGIRGKAITDIAIKAAKGSVKYRVHIKGGRWLPFVTGYDVNDSNNGYAGMGYAIDLIEVYYYTPSDVVNGVGYLRAKYRVSPTNGSFYPYQFDNEKTNGQDGYAGYPGKAIDQFQLTLSK